MSKPEFKTYWTIGEQRVDDIAEVEKRVLAGRVAVETSAEKQAKDYEMRLLQERWHRESLDRYHKYAAEAAHRDSPEGRAETARREAAQHGGSRVTVAGPKNDAFAELDQYGPDKTDVFK